MRADGAAAPAATGLTPDRPHPLPSGALVIGGDYRALGIVRSLGRRGIRVVVAREGDDRLSLLSRYARSRVDWPEGSDETKLDHLLALADSGGLAGWALFPSGDESAALIARHHEVLAPRFALTTPPWSVLRLAYDKRETHDLADRLGIESPWTLRPRDRSELESAAIPFPVVLKPAVKETFNRLTAAKAWRVDDRPELLARYDEACTLVSPDVLMVQEVVTGGGESQLSFACLCDRGRPLATIVARRTRQYPADFGRASTFVETVDAPEVVEPSVRLLTAMGFTGLVEVEYKRDRRDGRLKLLDVNPRVWGWHTLGARAGVDFSYLAWLAVSGRPVPELQARIGVRWVRGSTDLPTVARELVRRRLPVREYVKTLGGPRETAIFAADDPLPAVAELPLIASMLVRRLLRGSGV